MNPEIIWDEISIPQSGTAFRRVDEEHPLDLYVGKDSSGSLLLLLLTGKQVTGSKNHEAIHITSSQRQDGKWATIFRLVRPDLGKMFSLLVEDLVESSRNSPQEPGSFIMSRFRHWQKLLEEGRSGLLGSQALQGLMGELLFLDRVIAVKTGWVEGVRSWIGPTGGLRDFHIPGCEYEIKTTSSRTDILRITSAEQLEPGDDPLMLVHAVMDEEDFRKPGCITPLGLVNRIRDSLATEPHTLDLFDTRLMAAGFVRREEYEGFHYTFHGFSIYQVAASFPAVRRSQLPAGVGKVTWELLVSAIQPFRINLQDQERID